MGTTTSITTADEHAIGLKAASSAYVVVELVAPLEPNITYAMAPGPPALPIYPGLFPGLGPAYHMEPPMEHLEPTWGILHRRYRVWRLQPPQA